MPIALKHPTAPATQKQLFTLEQLTGEDYSHRRLTMQQVSDLIDEYELEQITKNAELQQIDDEGAFTEAHVTIVEGDQRGGKSNYAVGKIVDSYDKDCARIYLENVLKLGDFEVKRYYRKERVIKFKHHGQIKLVEVLNNYEMHSPMKIFSNIHLYGLPYIYIPSFRHMLLWLKKGFIRKGWLLSDESYKGMSARSGMSVMGKEFVGEYYQFGKSQLDVIIITHHARMIDYLARLIPTQRVFCRYDEKTRRVYYTLRKKGDEGTKEFSFDATIYWPNYRTGEKVMS